MKNKNYGIHLRIDLLPRLKGYNGDNIDWLNSIGISIPFVAGDISGKLEFIGDYNNKILVRRFINGYNYTKDVLVGKTSILHNSLTRSIFNEIGFTRPDLLKYFVNKEDAFKYIKTDNRCVYLKCPKCGFIKMNAVCTIDAHGFVCDRCSNKSNGYPNKFMISMLSQLQCKYLTEVNKSKSGFEWLENYRFDFVLMDIDKKYFIEMDGYFHFNDNKMNGRTAEEQKQIDHKKDKLANKYGYKVIRINCDYRDIRNRFIFIKTNILKSELSNILNLNETNIDWNKCDQEALSNILYVICDYWNSGEKDKKIIAKELNISLSCINTNLNKGAKLGLCEYDSSIIRQEVIENAKKSRSQPVKVLKEDVIVAVFPSSRELSRQSERLFNVYFNPGHISYSRRFGVLCHGYSIKDITHEEYDCLAIKFKTIQN